MYERIFESQYNGECYIYEYRDVEDPITHLTNQKLVKVNEEPIKCRLLFKSFPNNKDDVIDIVSQQVKLLINPRIDIKVGSVIEVTQNGITEKYENSGMIARYAYHQEINLKAVKERG